MMGTSETFRALWVEEADAGVRRCIVDRSIADLPPGDILVRVRYSSLNYKDALSASGNRGVTRAYPHTPGIDAAGTVAQSDHPDFRQGDEVIVTSYDLGMNTPGGFGQYIRVPAAWVVPKPEGLTLLESMTLGTAGLTAALSVARLMHNGVAADAGEVLVTGASGGVGSLAVAILSRLGFNVVAVSGKPDIENYLRKLGATSVVSRAAVTDISGKPLLGTRWAGAVDTVGGDILANVLKSIAYDGAVTCCGLTASAELSTTVYPFILRGVSLLGIDSQQCPMPLRREMWERLAGLWRPENLDTIGSVHPLADLEGLIERILAGDIRGRMVIDLG
jgi:acrylyl-CoA reductase (NADPH)